MLHTPTYADVRTGPAPARRRAALAALGLLLAFAGTSHCAPRLPLEFTTDPGWQSRPSFLANPAQQPEVRALDGCVTLRVAEPGKGMKFELPLQPFDSGSATFLLLRYRAQQLAGGYALWIYDASREGREVLNTSELVQDGQWHTVGVDLWARGAVGDVRSIVTEVQCRAEPAAISFDDLRLDDELPPGATRVPAISPPDQEVVLRPATLAAPTAQRGWLASPAERFQANTDAGALHLAAEGAGKGMKWALPLPVPVDLARFRYAAIRYRARNTEPWGDYFVWLGSGEGGMPGESATLLPLAALKADDGWHVAIVALKDKFRATHMATEVSSAGERGEVWLDTIRFSVRRPLLEPRDLLPVAGGWRETKLANLSFKPVDLAGQADATAQEAMRACGLKSWLPAGQVTVRGIPFLLPTGGQCLVSTPEDIDTTVGVAVGESGTEAYLLLAARLPAANGSRMGDPAPLEAVAAPERLVLQVEYGGGLVDEMIPVCLGSGRHEFARGLEVYCLGGLRPEPVRRIRVRNRMESARIFLGAVTLNQGRAVTPAPTVAGLPAPVAASDAAPGVGRIVPLQGGYAVENDLVRVEVGIDRGVTLRSVQSRCLEGAALAVRPGPLFELGDGKTLLTSEQVTVGAPRVEAAGATHTLLIPVDAAAGGVALKGDLTLSVGDGPDIGMRLNLVQAAATAFAPVVNFPLLKGVHIGTVEDTWYLWARKGGIISSRPTHQRQAYGGEYPLQVADVFSPVAGGGLALFTYDRDDIYRHFDLTKDRGGVAWRIDYWPREYRPGERIEVAPTALRAHRGDWRAALAAYHTWAQTWYKPQVPRKPWFQAVFYYQQTLAWSGLRDPQTGRWRVDEVIRRYRDYFGRLDYLHIFDFGQSMVYGRVGDYNHYAELGGLEQLRGAVKQAQDAGVPVGLYIEGYLCDRRGVWGRENVPRYDMRHRDGAAFLWDVGSTEHMMCPATAGWRDHLAATYQRVAGELKPDGMYIDQFGFLNPGKTCWSREHGHPVPWGPLRGERDTLQAIRAATPPTIATLTEETPNDVNSQYQDGALGYSVTWSDPELMPHRVDLFRFLFPSFKVFQLVSYNPFTEGGWDLLKWPFLNGEGYWLHGGTSEFYCEDAHRFLRRAFAILHEYEDAFCSGDVTPLIPTCRPTLYANRFVGARHTVWTLFNAEYRTFRGEALRVPHRDGVRYVDAFRGKAVPAQVEDARATLSVELGPQGVGCVVATAG